MQRWTAEDREVRSVRSGLSETTELVADPHLPSHAFGDGKRRGCRQRTSGVRRARVAITSRATIDVCTWGDGAASCARFETQGA